MLGETRKGTLEDESEEGFLNFLWVAKGGTNEARRMLKVTIKKWFKTNPSPLWEGRTTSKSLHLQEGLLFLELGNGENQPRRGMSLIHYEKTSAFTGRGSDSYNTGGPKRVQRKFAC